MAISKILLVSIASLIASGATAAERSSICTEFELPDLSDIGLLTREQATYPYAELGQSIHYQTDTASESSPFYVSLYVFDLGNKTITSEHEEETLRMAFRDIVEHPTNDHYTFDQPYQIPEVVFENLKPELAQGFHMRAISAEPLAHDHHFAAVGQYRDCFLKLRMTIGSGEPGEEDDIIGFKLLYGIANRIKKRLTD